MALGITMRVAMEIHSWELKPAIRISPVPATSFSEIILVTITPPDLAICSLEAGTTIQPVLPIPLWVIRRDLIILLVEVMFSWGLGPVKTILLALVVAGVF